MTAPIEPVERGALAAPLSRRRFLAGTAAVSLTAVMKAHSPMTQGLLRAVGGNGPDAARLPDAEHALRVPTPSFTFSVARDTDLVLLDFSFYGYRRLASDGVTYLVPKSASNVITVGFPPQAIGEAAYSYTASKSGSAAPWNVDPPPVPSVMSGPSLLCFTLDTGGSVPFTTMTAADLLDWSSWTLLVPANAKQGVTPVRPSDPRSAATPVTYIEYPYALFLCPTVYAEPPLSIVPKYFTTFVGKPQPLVGAGGVSDLWTAALQQFEVISKKPLVPQAAAVWARDDSSGDADLTPKLSISYEH
jgi:hypothetical protein